MKKNYVWVIEMKLGKKWYLCEEAKLTLSDARKALKWWQQINDEYRITKYEAVR
jgi:hypothetical protein